MDYKTASIQAQNVPPQYAPQVIGATPGVVSGGMGIGGWLLIGAGVIAAVALVASAGKG